MISLGSEKAKARATEQVGQPPFAEVLANLLPNGDMRLRGSIEDHIVPVSPNAPEDKDDRDPHVSLMRRPLGRSETSTNLAAPSQPPEASSACPSDAVPKTRPPAPPHSQGAGVAGSPAPDCKGGMPADSAGPDVASCPSSNTGSSRRAT
jgi:hypothetical protein